MVETNDPLKKKRYLQLSLVISLGTLAFFKYFNFFVGSFYGVLGIEKSVFWEITLPVGISFYIFQAVSYSIDLYRGNISHCHSLTKFLLYVSFFPQLVAGPIVRAVDFLPQLDKDIRIRKENVIVGAQLFLGGAIQKVIFADTLRQFADPIFAEPTLYSAGTLWLAMLAFAGQIFGDFAGYSLMAIGIARIFGFELPENFRMPYISRSITEFWRRWHKSLSFWLRDYLYISLGGNRKGLHRTYFNLIATMVLGGLWHGASWNFVLWGFLHGMALAIHKLWETTSIARTFKSNLPTANALFGWSLTFLFVCLLWIPFRAETFEISSQFLQGMFTFQQGIQWYHTPSLAIFALLFIWHSLYIIKAKPLMSYPDVGITRFHTAYALSITTLMIVIFAPEDASPFVYFQF
nr:MBOAT family O-acyltransferase [Marinibactrum halimedae]